MPSTSRLQHVRSNFLRAILPLTYYAILTLGAFEKLGERIRYGLLIISLSLVYFLVITPIALQRRTNPKNKISTWRDHTVHTGWHRNEQSTSDPKVFRTLSSYRDELVLMQKQGGSNSTLIIYDFLRPLRWFGRPPEEKELSADLYVMF